MDEKRVDEAEREATAATEAAVDGDAGVSGVPAEPADEARHRVEAELAEVRDRHIRLAAEFDNFRKRVLREKAELGDRAQAAMAGKLLDALDDLQRILASDPAATPAEALREGIAAVDRKLWKELGQLGLERVDPAGSPFDPELHEAVAMTPAPEGVPDQQVSATFQVGYRFKGLLVRPARVQVFTGAGGA